jgi:Family of unknown function (DUF6088)
MKSAMQAVRQHVSELEKGVPFTTRSVLQLGSRAAVDEALYRLTKEGRITRVGRGLYVRPRMSKYAGEVPPTPETIATVVASAGQAKVDIAGAAAANMLGLSTQMPTQSVFITDGPSRHINVGKMRVTLRHVSARKLTFAGTPAGRALTAFLYLGRKAVGPKEVAQVRRAIGEGEFQKLKRAVSVLPGWLTKSLRASAESVKHA